VIPAVTAAVVIVLDQITKAAVVRHFARGDQADVLGTVLRIGHAQNSGAVFGIFKGAGKFFMVFSIVASVIIIGVAALTRGAPTRIKMGLGLLLGGALGNLIDRLRFGAVVDFIDIGVGDRLRWPSFNVADAAITAGVVLLVASSLWPARPQLPADDSPHVF